MNGRSLDIDEKLSRLRQLFPEVFSEGDKGLFPVKTYETELT